MTITDHWLVEARRKQTPNVGTTFQAGQPDTIVIHYTAGSGLTSAVDSMCKPESKASAHLAVGRNGEVVQLVPFNRIAWHAGVSKWKERNGLNPYSLGIEVVNWGRLDKQGNSLITWAGQTLVESEGVLLKHKNDTAPAWWQTYPQPQLDKVTELCRALKKVYPIKEILGHDDISPGRKSDPGPAYPMDTLRKQILGASA